MDKAEQPTITQADREAAEAVYPAFLASLKGEDGGYGLAEAFARHRIAGQSASCDLGVGCDEAGVCYAKANGKPEMCHRTTSLAAQDGMVEALEDAEVILSQYANYLDGISYHELEMHPYIPSVQQTRDDVRKDLSAIKEQHHD